MGRLRGLGATATGLLVLGAGEAMPPSASGHYAFQPLHRPQPPFPDDRSASPLDGLVAARLEREGLSLGPEADRPTLIRRVAFVVGGLPPTPDEIAQFVNDSEPEAYDRMVDRYLDSPRYGERWGKHWLDAAGYADSNGYFNADSDRPLAYRYRDYVIRSLNGDKPFDQFVREQLAGDELAHWKPGQPVTPAIVELLEATHFLRNGQDGSGESDGNPDEVRADRYYALDSTIQIIGSSLLGLTVQCSRCHDHKFEPFSQKDYYALQAVLYPAFNIDRWQKPNDRVIQAELPGELDAWMARERQLDDEEAALKNEWRQWVAAHRVPGERLFEDQFDGASLAERWSTTAPGDDGPGGQPGVMLDGTVAPAAVIKDGALRLIEGGGVGDRWISTRRDFCWQPPAKGDWIQVTFDLMATRLDDTGTPADRVGYFIAAHDFNDSQATPGGNILIDGHPTAATTVTVDYPGTDAEGRGVIGGTGYRAGHEYGVRVTNLGDGRFSLEHLIDGLVDGASLRLKAADLPIGGFAFEYCCGRSFIVDTVRVEASRSSDPAWVSASTGFQAALAARRTTFEAQTRQIADRRTAKPGRIAWVTDLGADAPVVPLLLRGSPQTPGAPVDAATPEFLSGGRNGLAQAVATDTTTGRRLAWARWLTEDGSAQAALLARVTVNRLWERTFGRGLVATTDNLGRSGAPPVHPEALEWLAAEFVNSGWRLKSIHRAVLRSMVFRQSSAPRPAAVRRDPSDQWMWRFPVRRLDAEAIRDSMLAVSGRLAPKASGPYVPTRRSGAGEVLVDESHPDGLARSIFLQHRRTQVTTFLGLFDAPSIVFNCTRRAETTMPLQSLSLLNSAFVLQRAEDFADRLDRDAGPEPAARIRRAFLLATGRPAESTEVESAERFVAEQEPLHGGPEAGRRAWADFCQALLASNEFLYLQ